jgi:hypothetical protein
MAFSKCPNSRPLRGSLGIGLLVRGFRLLFARCGFVPGRVVGAHVYRGSNDQQLSDAFCSLDSDASTPCT